jgi:hypothetical protein
LIESVNPTWEDLSLDWGEPVELLDPSAANKQQTPRFARDDNSGGGDNLRTTIDLEEIELVKN